MVEVLGLSGDFQRDTSGVLSLPIKDRHVETLVYSASVREDGDESTSTAVSEEAVVAAWGSALCAVAAQPVVHIGVVSAPHADGGSHRSIVTVDQAGALTAATFPSSGDDGASDAQFEASASVHPGNPQSLHLGGLLVALLVDPATRQVSLAYDASLFAEASMRALADRFLFYLRSRSYGAMPPAELAKLQAFSGEPGRRELVELSGAWPETALPAVGCSVIELFKARAQGTPDKPAVVSLSPGDALTYGELDLLSDLVAARLVTLRAEALAKLASSPVELANGACLETPLVLLYFERSPRMVAAMLGAQKAGFGYVPVSVDYPAERVDFIVHDSVATAVLFDAAFAGEAGNLATRAGLVPIDVSGIHEQQQEQEQGTMDINGASPPVDLSSPDTAMYVLYTSGSTGSPKGVCLSTRAALSAVTATCSKLGAGDASAVVLQCTTYVFDLSVVEIYCPLVSGATLKLAPPRAMLQPEVMQRLLCEEPKPTWMQSTPSLLKVLITSGALKRSTDNVIQHLVVCGELLRQDIAIDAWKELSLSKHAARNGLRLYNAWGPTEAAVYGTARQFSSLGELEACANLSIGTPLPGRGIFILRQGQGGGSESSCELAALGAKGEICASGPCLAEGYLNLPGKSSAAFVAGLHPDPELSSRFGQPLYRCGDICRWRPDSGELEIFGRMDNQVKIRGFRVELGEVEAALAKFNQGKIAECAVLAKQTPQGAVLVAYVSPRSVSETDLRYGSLPQYMRPSLILTFDALPRNQSGKVDRKQLPEPSDAAAGQLGSAECEEEALSPTQETVLGALRRVVGQPRLRLADNYFQFGATSVTAVQLKGELDQELGLDLPATLFFDAPTALAIADACAKMLVRATPNLAVASPAAGRSQAKLALEPEPEPASPVVVMHQCASYAAAPSLFLFHPAGGVTYVFYELVGELVREMQSAEGPAAGREFNIYALQDPCIRDPSLPMAPSISAMVANYWAAIKQVQSSGVFFFGGHSLGGLLAVEAAALAQQDEGCKVGAVFLLDTDFQERLKSDVRAAYDAFASGTARKYVELKQQSLVQSGSRFRAGCIDCVKGLLPHGKRCGQAPADRANSAASQVAAAPSSGASLHTFRILSMVRQHMKMAQRHGLPLGSTSVQRPQPVQQLASDTVLVLFWAKQRKATKKKTQRYLEEQLESQNAWRQCADRFSLVTLEGASHLSMLRGDCAARMALSMVNTIVLARGAPAT